MGTRCCRMLLTAPPAPAQQPMVCVTRCTQSLFLSTHVKSAVLKPRDAICDKQRRRCEQECAMFSAPAWAHTFCQPLMVPNGRFTWPAIISTAPLSKSLRSVAEVGGTFCSCRACASLPLGPLAPLPLADAASSSEEVEDVAVKASLSMSMQALSVRGACAAGMLGCFSASCRAARARSVRPNSSPGDCFHISLLNMDCGRTRRMAERHVSAVPLWNTTRSNTCKEPAPSDQDPRLCTGYANKEATCRSSSTRAAVTSCQGIRTQHAFPDKAVQWSYERTRPPCSRLNAGSPGSPTAWTALSCAGLESLDGDSMPIGVGCLGNTPATALQLCEQTTSVSHEVVPLGLPSFVFPMLTVKWTCTNDRLRRSRCKSAHSAIYLLSFTAVSLHEQRHVLPLGADRRNHARLAYIARCQPDHLSTTMQYEAGRLYTRKSVVRARCHRAQTGLDSPSCHHGLQ
jgi:hypothetical protein